ncbi:MAG: nucleoside permease [Bacteroidales bacterium]|nr:nucleoside permease [Bacteroidales bacterium]
MLKFRLILMNFIQFFIWGCWLLTIGAYWFQTKKWSPSDFGLIFSTMGIASLFMPTIAGIIADKWLNAERLYALLHFLGGCCLFILPQINDSKTFFWIMLLNAMCYMPTISLAITICYDSLKQYNYDVIKIYPPIRVFGTIGFIVALWTISLTGLEKSATQFYVSSISAFLLSFYSLTLPKCIPKGKEKNNIIDALGLRAFTLFRSYKMTLFFIFSFLLGISLQLTNAYGDTFLHDFSKVPEYTNSIAVKYPAIIMSISQISETLFILTIPFFLKRFGIKNVMLMSMIAWVLRFGLFAFGNPTTGLWMIILSCIVYGMAFDFFNISGSLFVETQVSPAIRASSQGLFMFMTNGLGSLTGSILSGLIIEKFFKIGDVFIWKNIWLTFSVYSLVVAFLFLILFKHKHNPAELDAKIVH